MATHRHASLRERLLSNSPDPIKSSILRESGTGWASSQPGVMSSSSTSTSVTSPLRIAKRDSSDPQRGADVARRSSNSFKHVRNNNLVTKSPFKTQTPTPTAPHRPTSVVFPSTTSRRVSGEKRPRPPSMHEEAENENDRPFALKRDRKQSKTFQGLLEREPVTKSPFKKRERISGVDDTPRHPSPPPPPLPLNVAPISAITSQLAVPRESSPALATTPSPGRSVLVNRRVRGPRLSSVKKKKVEFKLRCEVLEFDRDTSDEDFWQESDEGERYGDPFHAEFYQDAEEGDQFFGGGQATDEASQEEVHHQLAPEVTMEEDSYDSIQIHDTDAPATRNFMDPDASITGLVDEILFSNATLNNVNNVDSITHQSIPDLPTDLETEEGAPFEEDHHVESLSQHEQHSLQHNQPHPQFSPHASPHVQQVAILRQLSQENNDMPYPYNLGLPTHASPHGPPATPPRPSLGPAQSTPPPDRSVHMEKILEYHTGEKEISPEELSMTFSPRSSTNAAVAREASIPKFKWPRGSHLTERHSPALSADASDQRREYNSDEPNRSSNDSLDPANLSIGNSEVSLNGLERSDIYRSDDEGPPESVVDHSSSLKGDPQEEDSASFVASNTSQEEEEILAPVNGGGSRSGSLAPSPRSELPSRLTPSSIPTPSPLNLSQNSSNSRGISPRPNMRHRISKDDIWRRLSERRSTLSPSPEPTSQLNSVLERMESPPTLEANPHEEYERQSPEVATPPQGLDIEEPDGNKEFNRMSVLTDISMEVATVQCAEKFNVAHQLPTPDSLSDKEFGMFNAGPNLQVTFGSKFSLGGLGLHRDDDDDDDDDVQMQLKENPEVLPARRDEADSSSISSGASMKVGDMDVSMDMKSALDRLMDDVAGVGGREEEDTTMTDEFEESYDQSLEITRPSKIQRAATDSDLLYHSEAQSRAVPESSMASMPPPPPPKDNIKAREQLILEKRREARRGDEGGFVPTRNNKAQMLQAQLGIGRPSRRRSLSAGDAQDLGKKGKDQLLSIGGMEKLVEEDLLSQSIERELKKLKSNEVVSEKKKSKYQIREHEGTIYASALEDKVSHMDGAGDLDTGKAWRTVRRPSDMDEYSKQIKEYRSQANPAKAYGKVFVKVLGIKVANVPLPQEATALTCTLNNGIHFVTTPECELSPDCRIDQEFELIEHSKLEFTLTMKIRRDPHIVAQFKALTPSAAPPPPPPPVIVQQSTSKGKRSFWSSSPKKPSKQKVVQTPPPPPPPVHRLPENLARYLKPDGTLARAFIQFKEIATRCNTRLFETSYPLIGQRVEASGKFSTLQVGEIVLQIFRLPPLPGIPADQLPQSLDECHRGLRHINWHKMTYFQGALTQSGGDCNTRRRRLFRVIGAKLVAFSDITKKATATIDLKKAIAVQDDQDLRNPLTPLARSRGYDEDDLFGLQRSFRLIFPQDQEIVFFADTDEDKFRWLEVLRALVGHIPPHPLWAELLWQRQEESSKRTSEAPAAQVAAEVGH